MSCATRCDEILRLIDEVLASEPTFPLPKEARSAGPTTPRPGRAPKAGPDRSGRS